MRPSHVREDVHRPASGPTLLRPTLPAPGSDLGGGGVKRRPEIQPLTVFTHPELAQWLKVSERTLDRLKPPALPLTDGCRRYLLADVLDWLKRRAA